MDCQQDELVDNGDGMVWMSGIDDVSVAHTLVPLYHALVDLRIWCSIQ